MKHWLSLIHSKPIKLFIIVLWVTCQVSYDKPHVTAFITSKNEFTCFSKSTTVGMKHNYQYKLKSSGDFADLQKYDNAEELELCDSINGVSKSEHPPTNRRRELLRKSQQQVSSFILASLISGESTVHAQPYIATEPLKAKTIVITGANSGIGFEACKRLIAKGHTVIFACRSLDKAQDAINRIQQDDDIPMNGKLIPAECDLADLSSIRKFIANVATNVKIDTLCLNAGVARNTAATDCARTKDGFELTGTFYYLNHCT